MNSSNLQLNNITNILLVTTTTIILVLLLIQQVAQAQAQAQVKKGLFFITLQLDNPGPNINGNPSYDVKNITTNIFQNISQQLNPSAKIEYDLANTYVTIANHSDGSSGVIIYWDHPFSIIGTNSDNPNIITTTPGEISLCPCPHDNYMQQFDTSTNIITHTGDNLLFIDDSIRDEYSISVDVKLQIFPSNNTAVLEMTEIEQTEWYNQ
jgi:hypothetical protein